MHKLFDKPVKELLTFRLARMHALLNGHATKVLRQYGDLTLMQWRMLALLDADPKTSISQLALETGLDKALLSRTAKALVGKGLIKTKAHASDHRQSILLITPEGRAEFNKAFEPMLARQLHLGKSISPEQRAALMDAFDAIEAALGEPKN